MCKVWHRYSRPAARLKVNEESALALAFTAILQMHLHDVRHLGLAEPMLSRKLFASLKAQRNCFPTAFGIPAAACFKFPHLDTRHWLSLHNSK